ncbi:MAG: flagellar hook protein FlgE [Geothrix sp.]|nr:flagellar hook protein FlgE [Geothrix sp.]
MSLYSAFYSGLSGLASNANALNVVGNNLSNINTVGFKGSSTSFSDIFSSTISGVSIAGNGDPMQFGLGTQVNGVSQNFSQSSFQSASSALDMAIQGNGFFTLQTASGQQVYTRDGSFSQNSNGYLVASDGSNVLGYAINPVTGVLAAAAAPIQIASGITSPASATTTITPGVNLDSSSSAGAILASPIQVYDSLGNAQSLVVTYTNNGTNPNSWNYVVTGGPSGATITGKGSSAANPGTIVFNTDGSIQSVNGNALPTPPTTAATTAANASTDLGITWGNGAAASTIQVAMVQANGQGNITQYAAPSATSSTAQDGYAAGTLSSLAVDQSGIISGTFTNGQIQKLAQVALSTFNNVNGLIQAGNNAWTQSLASGSPSIGIPNQGGRGGILGSNLELSNVDVATEFTNMILNQRGYEANSKIITTTDQLMQATLAMKQ